MHSTGTLNSGPTKPAAKPVATPARAPAPVAGGGCKTSVATASTNSTPIKSPEQKRGRTEHVPMLERTRKTLLADMDAAAAEKPDHGGVSS